MKKILPLLLICLLLVGCTQKSSLSGAPSTPEGTSPTRQTDGLYDENYYLASETSGAVRCYPLDTAGENRLYSMGDRLILLRGHSDGTTIEVYAGTDLHQEAFLETGLPDFVQEPSLRVSDNGISYFDPEKKEIALLDHQLRVIRQVAAPEGLIGVPLLSDDGKVLFYCTGSEIRALDTDSGLSRVLQEVQGATASGILFDGSVIQCQVQTDTEHRAIFISSENGRLLGQLSQPAQVSSWADCFFASFLDGSDWGGMEIHSYGQSDDQAQMMDLPIDESFLGFLPKQNRALSWAYRQDAVEINLYNLSEGTRTSTLRLPQYITPLQAVSEQNGGVYLLLSGASEKGDIICLWDPQKTAVEDPLRYTAPYASPEHPDQEGMEACRNYAQALSSRIGIHILVGEDAVAYQPEDYRLREEYLTTVTQRELELLEQRLGNFPQGFLATLAGNFDGLNICLVRAVSGSDHASSLHAAAGLQYWDGGTAYIALSTLETEQTLYHELCHLIDTQVINNSNAYDTWGKFNPSDFEYDNDYIQNRSRDGSKYLTPGSEAFIDTYSMSFPKEDRARILEYAMTPGHEGLFQSSILQSKLKQICIGIREGFGLTESQETYLWEQYLWTPLAGGNSETP